MLLKDQPAFKEVAKIFIIGKWLYLEQVFGLYNSLNVYNSVISLC